MSPLPHGFVLFRGNEAHEENQELAFDAMVAPSLADDAGVSPGRLGIHRPQCDGCWNKSGTTGGTSGDGTSTDE
jgi:hypothetical protein